MRLSLYSFIILTGFVSIDPEKKESSQFLKVLVLCLSYSRHVLCTSPFPAFLENELLAALVPVKTIFHEVVLVLFECCQDDNVNCSCFRKDKNETQGLFDPCACTSQDEYCTTELYLSVDKLKKKKNKQQGRQQQGRDGVSTQMSMSM